ncbi:Crp/Fnr family transcriptional regulator, partial [Candidatus Enterococcus murrayae]
VEVTKKQGSYISAFIFENDLFGLDAFSSFPSKNHAIKVLSSGAIIYRVEKNFLLTSLNQRTNLYELLLTNFTDVFQRHYLFENFLSLSPTERTKKSLSYLSDFIGEINEAGQIQTPMEITQEVLARFCRTSQSRISICLKELKESGFLLNRKAPFILK